MSKPYSCPTSPKQGTDVETKVDRSQTAKIWGCPHLTPATEAKMDGLLFGTEKDYRKETIRRNSPGHEPPPTDDWEDVKGPTKQDLNAIRQEEIQEERARVTADVASN